MNEQIKQLAEHAGSTHKQNLGVYQFYTDELEKFAELIIQECANELLKWKSEPFPLDPESAARIIKDHFGVK